MASGGKPKKAKEAKLSPQWAHLAATLKANAITTVFDIGANTGQYATWLRQSGYTGHLVSFEPLSDAHAMLQEAAAGDGKWTVAPRIALGHRIGKATINRSAESDMSSILPLTQEALGFTPSSKMTATEEVGLTTLDEVFGRYASPDDRVFVKVDTQGYESAVLLGAMECMPRIDGWQLELSLVQMYEGEPPWREVADVLIDLGYEPHLIIPGYFSRHIARMLQFDAVFFRGLPTAR
jgi:FkbM family methyltransferase